MASQTFNRFSELPAELQIQIWKDAANPLGEYDMRGDTFITLMRDQRFGKHASYSPGFFSWIFTAHFSMKECSVDDDGATTAARATLMSTCRVSRQITLELWRKEVRSITLEGTAAWFKEAIKREIVYLVQGLIEALVGTHKTAICEGGPMARHRAGTAL